MSPNATRSREPRGDPLLKRLTNLGGERPQARRGRRSDVVSRRHPPTRPSSWVPLQMEHAGGTPRCITGARTPCTALPPRRDDLGGLRLHEHVAAAVARRGRARQGSLLQDAGRPLASIATCCLLPLHVGPPGKNCCSGCELPRTVVEHDRSLDLAPGAKRRARPACHAWCANLTASAAPPALYSLFSAAGLRMDRPHDRPARLQLLRKAAAVTDLSHQHGAGRGHGFGSAWPSADSGWKKLKPTRVIRGTTSARRWVRPARTGPTHGRQPACMRLPPCTGSCNGSLRSYLALRPSAVAVGDLREPTTALASTFAVLPAMRADRLAFSRRRPDRLPAAAAGAQRTLAAPARRSRACLRLRSQPVAT